MRYPAQSKRKYKVYIIKKYPSTANLNSQKTIPHTTHALPEKNTIFLLLRELCLMSMGTCLRCAQSGASKKNMPKNLTTCGK